jgi:enoyl-CoA hydratase
MGFVQEVVPANVALGRALELAEAIAGYPAQRGIRTDRASAIAAYDGPLAEGLDREGRDGFEALADPEMAEGLQRFASGDRPEAPRPAG